LFAWSFQDATWPQCGYHNAYRDTACQYCIRKGPAACNVLVSIAVTQLDCFSKLSHLAGVASQTQKARLDKLREWPSSSDTASSSTPDKATAYLLVLSLLVWSPTQWTVSRQSVLLYLLLFAFSQQQPSTASSSSSTGAGYVSSWREQSDEEIWRCACPVIKYFGLMQCMCQQLKGDSDADWHAHAKSR